MSEKSQEEENAGPAMSPTKRWVRRILIVVLVLAALFVTGLIVASKMTNHDAIKAGFKDYIAAITNSEVIIGNFEHVAFYPSFDIRLQALTLRPYEKPGLSAEIGDLKFKMKFWDIFMGRPRAAAFDVSRVYVSGGWLSRFPLHIESLRFTDDGYKDSSGLVGEGHYGKDPFTLGVELEKREHGYGVSYFTYPVQSDFTFVAPFLDMAGTFVRAGHGGLEARFDKISLPDAPPLNGEIDFVIRDENFHWHGKLHTENSIIEVSLEADGDELEGTISFLKLAVEDLALLPAISELIRLFVMEQDSILPDAELELAVDIAELTLRDSTIGRLAFPLKLDDNVLSAGPVKGNLLGGKVDGKLAIHESAEEASYDLFFSLDDADFGQFDALLYDELAASETADLKLKVNGRAPLGDALPLDGSVELVTAQGRVETPFAAIWESDILPALKRPDETRLKCFFAKTLIFIPNTGDHPCDVEAVGLLEGEMAQ